MQLLVINKLSLIIPITSLIVWICEFQTCESEFLIIVNFLTFTFHFLGLTCITFPLLILLQVFPELTGEWRVARAGGESSEHFVAVACGYWWVSSLFCLLLCSYCAMCVSVLCVCVFQLWTGALSLLELRLFRSSFIFHLQVYIDGRDTPGREWLSGWYHMYWHSIIKVYILNIVKA